ncbi:MAG: HEPN domain-containing protein [Bacteroidota bacterium]|nr:HEPN domain-containing protein [Bacteroidota bacterium]
MKEFEKWFKKAENDLLVITNNLASVNIPVDACCFHAQQAAEKYLKAYLISKEISFPKIHDLIALNNLCINLNTAFVEIQESALRLSDYAITPRYPDALDDLTLEDAKKALQDALTIKNFILRNFFK